MKDKIFLLILAALSLLISCSLERGPFDPVISGKYPPDIDTLWFANDEITLTWNVAATIENDSIYYANGYYIYAAQKYYGKYDRIKQNYSKEDTTFSVDEAWFEYYYRWFKVSSYILCPDTLEGHYSETITPPH